MALSRVASDLDVPALVRLVNRAYEVEAFFVTGDRTNADDVRTLMTTGQFLVLDEGGALSACVYTTVTGTRGYFGMLAVEPPVQGRGLGRVLIEDCERRARGAGAAVMDIKVVNLRTDLLALYGRFGYVAIGTEPYEHRPTTRPCHFVLMHKPLAPA